jgi:methionyl-tRNA synthetase
MSKTNSVMDYAPLVIQIRRQLRDFESAMNEREFKQAYETALEIVTEARLLVQITKESHV